MTEPRTPLPLPWWLRPGFWRWVLRAVVGLLLLLTALVAWILLYPPSLAPVREELQDLASSRVDHPVAFEDLSWTWAGGLKVRVSGVEVGGHSLRVERVRVGVELLPLLRGEVRLQELELIGLNLEMEHSGAGRLSVGGLRMAPEENRVFGLLDRFQRIRIVDSRLRWKDQGPAEPVRVTLRDWQVDLEREPGGHRVEARGSLDRGVVGARGRIGRFGAGPPGWQLDARVFGSALSPEPLRPYLGKEGPARLRGSLAFQAEVTGSVEKGLQAEGSAHLTEAGLRWPAALRRPVNALHAEGGFRYRWDREGQEVTVRDLELGLGGVRLAGGGELRMDAAGGAPWADLELEGESASLEDLAPLFRIRALPRPASAWLQRALSGSLRSTRLVVRGPLERFPFPEGEGQFRLEAEVAEATLDYRPGWPELQDVAGTLTVDGPRLGFDAHRGRVLEADLGELEVSVPDLTAAPPRLRLSGDLDLRLADGIRFLERSGLAQAGLPEPGGLAGRGRLDLGMDFPLSSGSKPEVFGQVRLDEAAYRPAPGLPALVGVEGQVGFQGPHIRADGLQGRLLGEPVRLDLAKGPEEALRARVEGTLPARALQEAARRIDHGHPLLRRVTGDLGTRVTLVAGEGRRRLRARLDLEEAALAFPEPLFNGIGEGGSLELSGDLGGVPELRIRLRHGGRDWRARWVRDGAEVAMAVGFDRPAPEPEEGSLRLRGELGTVALQRWIRLARDLHPGAGGAWDPPRLDADLRVGKVRWGARDLYAGRVEARGDPAPGGYRLHGALEGDRGAGRYLWQHRREGVDRAVLRIGRLTLPGLGSWGGGGGGGLGPADIPPVDLQVTADRIALDGPVLRDLRMEASLSAERWMLPVLQARVGKTDLGLQGAWTAERDRTLLQMDLETQDLGRWLRDVGIYPSMKGGAGAVEAALGWPSHPLAYGGGRLEGVVDVAVGEGEIEELHFLSKALSTLNVLDWPQQAVRGFRDLGRSGLVYRDLAGGAVIDDGVLTIQELALESAALRLAVRGGVNLGDRTYDLGLHLQPLQTVDRVVSAVPLVGYLLTGREKAFATLDYRVEGPWDDPRVGAVNPSEGPDFMEVLLDRIKEMQWEDLAPWR
ncbi:MAG: YhdP family protein [Thiohalorhabdus sp.]